MSTYVITIGQKRAEPDMGATAKRKKSRKITFVFHVKLCEIYQNLFFQRVVGREIKIILIIFLFFRLLNVKLI